MFPMEDKKNLLHMVDKKNLFPMYIGLKKIVSYGE